MKYLVLLACLFGCVKTKSHQTDAVPQSFNLKYKAYFDMALNYPEGDCDWLLFQSLIDTVLIHKGSVERAEGEPGQWFRTPGHDCLISKKSGSDVSRDMLLGLALYLWQVDDRKNVQEVMDYADEHGGVMGAGDKYRTDIRPVLYNTFKSIYSRTGQIPLPPKVDNPDIDAGIQSLYDLTTQNGYEAHILVLHILLRGLVYGELSALEMNILADQTARQPRNAFFQAVYHKFLDGDQATAISILMDKSLFPDEKLPTNENYCEAYLWQRDMGVDWQPCGETSIHTGADWLVAATVVRNGFRESHE